ncbi:hypothetical protein DMH18_17565 [Streptomyces sp. WAC 06783]|uniref:hypothetical protein n=1 Tax=Streptomyces sp. WAC 06783 TaxID=2203211 RepID=UPI000F73524E|nr:hypothetical protein [Streptomyces sp. WAC 06783]RSO09253.1 hypothetical protein DMH18_17565 [Streptomyces sp. WAC 06783]
MSGNGAQKLAESVLRKEFRRQVVADPARALAMVEGLVFSLHAESGYVTQAALESGVSWREIGRASALIDDAGILLCQAAALLLGLSAADCAAEQEIVDQALAECDGQVGDEVGELSGEREPDVWAAAVDRFWLGARPGSVGA